MEQVVLEVTTRLDSGKGVARKLRADGFVPGVAYGLEREPISLTVPRDELNATLLRGAGANAVFDLRIDGRAGEKGIAALVKSIQRHPLTRIPESVDFQWISLLERVTISVGVVLEGESPAQAEGAVIDQILYHVDLSCMPLEIPEHVVMSIEGMQLNETRTAAELQVPEGAEIITDPSEPVVTCTHSAQAVSDYEGEMLEGELGTLEEGGGSQGGGKTSSEDAG